MLFNDCVKAGCDLDNKMVYSEQIPLDPGESILGMEVDKTRNTYWIYTNKSLFELLITEEDRYGLSYIYISSQDVCLLLIRS